MPATVPTKDEFDALAARVTALEEGGSVPPDPPKPSTGHIVAGWGGWWWNNDYTALPNVREPYTYASIPVAQSAAAGSGRVKVDWGGDLATEIKAWKDRGNTAILLIGGGNDGGITLTSTQHVNDMVSSIRGIVDKFGLQGIDWDLESDRWNPKAMADASAALRTAYGAQFIVSVSPRPYEMRAGGPYRDFCNAMKDFLYLVTPQWYDYQEATNDSQQRSIILRDVKDFITVVPQDILMMGCALPSTAWNGWASSVQTYKNAWADLVSAGIDLAGSQVWTITGDVRQSYQWADGMAAVMG